MSNTILIRIACSLILLSLFTLVSQGQSSSYPVTEKYIATDTFYSQVLNDEYRWLEDLDDIKVKEWIEQQNALTSKELRKAAQQENSYTLIDKYSYSDYDNPQKQGDYYFTYAYYNNVSVPALFCQVSLRDNPTVLVDPNFISAKDDIIIKGYAVSGDSRLLAFQFSRNGSDWAEIMVVNIKTGMYTQDHLKNVKFSGISWKDDGFYYSRFPDPGLGQTLGQEVYYHKTGTSQDQDILVFKRANNPEAFFTVFTTSDERFLILTEKDEKKDSKNIYYIDFKDSVQSFRPLITRMKSNENLTIIDNREGELIATTFKGGNNGMIVSIDPKNSREWKAVVPEFKSALLLDIRLLENKMICIYQTNRKQQITFFDYGGKVLNAIQLPFGFSCRGFSGEKSDTQLTFSYSGYTQPPMVYILDTETYKMSLLKATVVNFDVTLFETKEIEYESYDGTKVPLFMVCKKGLDLSIPHPAILSAYGGFGSISEPTFDPGIVHFLMNEGIYAFANIRGGGDVGKEWAEAGRGRNKMNSFNDFISAAEFLIDSGYTDNEKLAITGASNGGLVVGVAMTKRPELFKVAVPVVAPLDMIRLEKFTIGHLHNDEYGSISDSAGFFNLLSYSPLHNIKEDVDYPATLIMTSENDDRVPPFHSYKFVASLQNRPAQTNPVLLRVELSAGHSGAIGSFKSTLKEEADMFDFIMYHLGVN